MKVIICGLLKFPDGDAGSIRQDILAKMFRECGLDVLVVGLGPYTGNKKINKNGYKYTSLRKENNGFYGKTFSHILFYKNFLSIVKKEKPKYILIDDIGVLKTIALKKYCKIHKIQLIHDSVEWYSPEQFKYGKFSFGYLRKDILNKYVIDKQFKVIAISRYLYNHFSSKGIKTLLLPILTDKSNINANYNYKTNKIVYSYAGQPGKKDYLNTMIEAFYKLPKEYDDKYIFNIIGCTKEMIINSGISPSVLNKIEKNIVFYGRVSHDEVINILSKTDFTILIRSEKQRYAKAGFPTKFVESISHGVPVICNLTSDLELYVKDGLNSIEVKDDSVESLVLSLIYTMRASRTSINEMKTEALKTAINNFNYKKYVESFSSFLEKTREEKTV